jgi:hypothetical protein
MGGPVLYNFFDGVKRAVGWERKNAEFSAVVRLKKIG